MNSTVKSSDWLINWSQAIFPDNTTDNNSWLTSNKVHALVSVPGTSLIQNGDELDAVWLVTFMYKTVVLFLNSIVIFHYVLKKHASNINEPTNLEFLVCALKSW